VIQLKPNFNAVTTHEPTVPAGKTSSVGLLFSSQPFVLLLALLAFLCGCSSFNRDWKHAQTAVVNENSIAGRWEGYWISSGGHHGRLRCLMSPETNSICQARFHAIYGRIFHFTYTVPLEMQPHDLGWEFNGEANLGKLAGGVYYYEGRATTTNLISTYRCKYEHGKFELERRR
jgi:hypothetical protein